MVTVTVLDSECVPHVINVGAIISTSWSEWKGKYSFVVQFMPEIELSSHIKCDDLDHVKHVANKISEGIDELREMIKGKSNGCN